MSGPPSEFGIPAVLSVSAPAKSRQLSPDEGAVLELFDALQERLFRYLTSSMLTVPGAEEIIQETFLALFQHLKRGGARDNLKGWLFRVAHNLALKKRYRDLRDHQNLGATLSAEELVADPGLNPEDQFAARQMRARLMAVWRHCPSRIGNVLF